MSYEKLVREVSKMLDVAKAASERADVKELTEESSKEAVDEFIGVVQGDIETTKNEGENIIARLRAGVISKDVAKKQLKNLLTNKCGEMLGLMMKARGVPSDFSVSEENIRKALSDINSRLS